MTTFRLGSTAIGYIIARSAPAVAGMLIIPILVKTMTSEGFTSYGQSLALVNALIGLAAGWLNQSQMRFAHLADRRHLWLAKFLAVIVNSAVGIALVSVGAYSFGLSPVACSVLYVAMLVGLVVTTDALAMQRHGRFMAMEIARAAVVIGSVVIYERIAEVPESRIVVGIIAISYLVPVGMAANRRFGHWSGESIRSGLVDATRVLRKLWRFGWPVGLWIFLSSAMQILDREFTERVFGSHESARYIALFEIYFRGVSLAMFPLVMVAYPEMIRRWSNGESVAVAALARRILMMQLGSLVPVALVSAWSVGIVMPMLGMHVRDGDGLLACLLALSAVIWQLVLMANKPLELNGRTVAMLAVMLATQVVFLLGLFLGKDLGLKAAPVAYIASGFFYILAVFLVVQSLPVSSRKPDSYPC